METGASGADGRCVVVGGGPGGAMLALLLARKGVRVTLLEAHTTWDREFRGNTLNPAALDILAELGLIDRLLALRHAKIRSFAIQTGTGPLPFADFSRLRTRFPFVMMLPQSDFLQVIIDEARRYPNFELIMGARVEELIWDDGAVRGVRYRAHDGEHELRALLTIGADGRYSRLRRLAQLEPKRNEESMDVLWLRLPRHADDPDDAGALFRFGPRCLVVLMDHGDHWQIGYIMAKGGYGKLREAGLPALRRTLAQVLPEFESRLALLGDWQQCSLLAVESSCLERWYTAGLLLIGDAAHVMSPIGGVGINHAILDAVVAAEVLAGPLLDGRITQRELHAVQRRRREPTRLIQLFQATLQRWGVDGALRSEQPFRLPLPLRLALHVPLIRQLPAWLIAFGAWPVHLRG